MAKLTVTDSQEFESPPAGVYAARCVSITPDDGQFGPSYKWIWEIVDVLSTEDDDEAREFVGEEIWGWSSQSPSTKGKFVKWAAAHLGVAALAPNQQVDTDDFVGATVRLTLDVTTDAEGVTKHKVAAIGVHKKGKRAAQVVEDDDDEPEPLAAGGRNRRRGNEPF